MSDVQNTEKPKNAIQKAPIKSGGSVEAIVPQDLDEAWRLSVTFVKAGMVPASYKGQTDEETVSKIMMGIMKGLEVGFKPQAALANIMIVNNRPSVWGDGAIGLVQNSGKLEDFKEWHEGEPFKDDWTAHCLMKRVGIPEPTHTTFSYGEAKAAKLTTKVGPWMSYPRRMLQMRARAFAIRDGFSDVLHGLGIVEEQQDIPAPSGPVQSLEFLDDSLPAAQIDNVPQAPEKPACSTCEGRGVVEDAEGKGPCPDCAKVPAVQADFLNDTAAG